MSPLDVLAEKSFDFYVDWVGNLCSRAGETEFVRDFSVRLSTRRPLWAVVDFSSDPSAEVSIELKCRKLVSRIMIDVYDDAVEFKNFGFSGL